MTLLPIVDRELREAARRPGTYRRRILAALLGLGVFVWMAYAGSGPGGAQDGRVLFRVLLVVAAFYAAGAALTATADALSRERREGTLGLLFLTDLGTMDIVLGKFTAALLDSLYSLLGVLPVLWLTIQLGGVSGMELAFGVASLLNLSFFCLALGLLVSVHSRDARKAMFAAWFALFFCTVGPPLIAGLVLQWVTTMRTSLQSNVFEWVGLGTMLDPFFGVLMLVAGGLNAPLPLGATLSARWLMWGSLVASHGWGWLMLWVTARRLRTYWHAVPRRTGAEVLREAWEQWTFGRGRKRLALRRRLLGLHPVVWLMHRERGKAWYAWLYFGFVLSVWAVGNGLFQEVLLDLRPALPGLLLIQGFLKVWVLSESAMRLSEDRRVGAMELLLTTPLTLADMARGHWLALRRQFLWPVVVFALMQGYVLNHLFGPWTAAATTLVFAADLVAVAWAGMWFAVSSRDVNRAIAHGFGLILVLPWVCFWFWATLIKAPESAASIGSERSIQTYVTAWCVLGLCVDLVLGWGWCRLKLLRDGPRVLSERGGKG